MAVSVHLTGDERTALKAKLAPLGLGLSTALVKVARELIHAGPVLLDDDMSQVVQAIIQLQGIAGNLNQITRAVHTSKGNRIVIDQEFLAAVQDSSRQVMDALRVVEHRQRERWVPIIEASHE